MALFTPKPFEKPRACHDHFQHLKGNIRTPCGSINPRRVDGSSLLVHDLCFARRKGLLEGNRGAEMLENIVFNSSQFGGQADTHPL